MATFAVTIAHRTARQGKVYDARTVVTVEAVSERFARTAALVDGRLLTGSVVSVRRLSPPAPPTQAERLGNARAAKVRRALAGQGQDDCATIACVRPLWQGGLCRHCWHREND